jgi:hypothetical protein
MAFEMSEFERSVRTASASPHALAIKNLAMAAVVRVVPLKRIRDRSRAR